VSGHCPGPAHRLFLADRPWGVSLRFRGWEALLGVGRPEPLVSHVVAAPVVGLLADRASRPRLVVASAALGFGCALAVTAAGLGRHPAAAGWLLTSVAAGGLLGSLAGTWRPAAPEHAATVVMGGLAAAGIPLAVAAVLPAR